MPNPDIVGGSASSGMTSVMAARIVSVASLDITWSGNTSTWCSSRPARRAADSSADNGPLRSISVTTAPHGCPVGVKTAISRSPLTSPIAPY